MHFPIASLCASCLGSLRGVFGVRMKVGEREVSKCKAQAMPQLLLHRLDNRIGFAAVRTFEIAILKEYQGRLGISLNVVAFDIRKGESCGRNAAAKWSFHAATFLFCNS